MTSKHLKILAIDPGSVSGAYAILSPQEAPVCADIPVVDRMVNGVVFSSIVREAQPDVAIIEAVSAMPKQGATSGFRFGFGTGLIHGVLCAHLVPVILVHATRWKKFHRLGSDKEASRALAVRLFPDAAHVLTRKKDHGRAEALLMAKWYQSTESK